MIKLNNPIVALLVTSIMTAQQIMIWNILGADPMSQLDDPYISGDFVRQRGEYSKQLRIANLSEPPTNIFVLGERNSGTNYVAKVLKQAFDPPNQPDPSRTHEYFSADIPVFLHKHMFRHSLLNETELQTIRSRTDILWIFAVRSPCEWAEAMKRMPWHMCHPNNIERCPDNTFIGFERKKLLEGYSLEQFFHLPWGDWPESTSFRNLSFVSDDYTYQNIFQLRRHKLMLMKQIIDEVAQNVKIVRLHELERSPEVFIQNLVLQFNLTLKTGYKTQQPSARIHREKCLSQSEWEIAQREIDWQIEGAFGYTSLDCHVCY